MKPAIKCQCPKCGEIGTQRLLISKQNKPYLQIIHKGKVCSLDKIRSTEEALKEMGCWN